MANDMNFGYRDAERGYLDCRPAPTCDTRPICPACGALECFCRPHFFAGQLLTEEELNRLDHYITAKSRLHNRHLFGAGVVCGLEVVCSTCDPTGSASVVVKAGYAISPCGNDIVVCREDAVNVCDLINQCRPRIQDDCLRADALRDDCLEGDEEWVLAICYQEKPSRGVTALVGPSCNCGGSCGGSGCGCGSKGGARVPPARASGVGCGCTGGSNGAKAKTRAAARASTGSTHCEPTLTCEGYTFRVFRKPKVKPERDFGPLIQRAACCLLPMFERLMEVPDGMDPDVLQQWLVDLMAALREFALGEGLYDCELATRLTSVPLPSRAKPADAYMTDWTNAVLLLVEIMASIMQKCICMALLPPCPSPALDDCVPIATLTVARGSCRVKHVCNLGGRKLALTFPSIRYWLSWLPWFSSWGSSLGIKTIRESLEEVCCKPLYTAEYRDPNVVDVRYESKLRAGEAVGAARPAPAAPAAPPAPAGVAARAARRDPAAAEAPGENVRAEGDKPISGAKVHPFAEMLLESAMGFGKANPSTVVLTALGARAVDGRKLASDLTMKLPTHALLIHQMIGPTLAPFLPLLGLVTGAKTAGGSASADVGSLSREVADLKKTLVKQQALIEKLAKR